MSDPMQEIRASFFVECEELLEALQDGLEAMSEGGGDDETVNVVFRAVHSIKGGAGAFGLDDLVAFTHTFETALDEVRSGRITAGPAETRLFFSSADILTDLVQAAREELQVSDTIVAPVRDKLIALVGADGAAEAEEPDLEFTPMAIELDLDLDEAAGDESVAGTTKYEIAFAPTPELFASGNEPNFVLRALSDLGPMQVECRHTELPGLDAYDPSEPLLEWRILLETDASESEVLEVFEFVEGLCRLECAPLDAPRRPDPVAEITPPDAADTSLSLGEHEDVSDPANKEVEVPAFAAQFAPKKPSVSSQNPKPKTTVRVDLDRIDRLVNLVGELVINQAMLSQSIGSVGLNANSPISAGLDELLQLTRSIQESVMMIRAQPVKSLFQRMARIVRESSKELNKDVRFRTEGETTEIDKTVIERLADPLTHMIRNAVDHGLESATQRIDAGKPADGTITLSAAHRSGRVVIEICDDGGGIDRERVKRIAEERGLIAKDQPLSDTEIDNLLFLPGFSTADQVSNLSGRGVGMDVVRNAITALGGRISISSETGSGTTFSISLPLTLAVLDGMVVRVASETLVVPLSVIDETLSLAKDDIKPIGPGQNVVQVRDQFVPLLDLGAELGYRAPLVDYAGAIVLLLSEEDGNRSALIVDAIEDQRQVVIKGLQDSYGRVPGVAAATILGDGQIALILDPVDLMANAGRRGHPLPQTKKAVHA